MNTATDRLPKLIDLVTDWSTERATLLRRGQLAAADLREEQAQAHLVRQATGLLEELRDALTSSAAADYDYALDIIDAELDLREFEAAAFGPNEVRR